MTLIGHLDSLKPADKPSLHDALDIVRRRKWVVLVFTILTIGASVFYTYQQPVDFRSESQVLVRPIKYSLAAINSEFVNLETETSLAKSPEVAEIAVQLLPSHLRVTPQEAIRHVSVSAIEGTEIVRFSYVDADAEMAQAGAQAFAVAYLESRRSQFIDELTRSGGALQERISAAQQRLGRLNERLSEADDELEKGTLQAAIAATQSEISLLNQQAVQLTPPDGLNVGRVVQAAAQAQPSLPAYQRNAVIAAILGFSLAFAAALIAEHLDQRLRGQAQLEMHAGAAMLAAIPPVHSWRSRKKVHLASSSDPMSPVAEAYRTLRTSVHYALLQRNAKVIMVTSPEGEEGKSATVANLGVALATGGKRVLLISADLRRPRLHLFFEVNNGTGLTSILNGEKDLTTSMRWTHVENLAILPSGPVPHNPAELLASDRMKDLVQELRDGMIIPPPSRTAWKDGPDIILIDTPPVLPVSDAMILAPLTDGVLLLGDAQKTKAKQMATARQRLDQVDANVLGSILNRAKDASSGAYYHNYSLDSDNSLRSRTLVPPRKKSRERSRVGKRSS